MRWRIVILSLALALVTVSPLAKQAPVKSEPPKAQAKASTEVQKQATWVQKKSNKSLAKKYAQAGWGWSGKEWRCLDAIFLKESRYDHLADNKNSTAFGIGQRLKESSKDPATQLLKTDRYVKHRYETPCRAYRFHQIHNYY